MTSLLNARDEKKAKKSDAARQAAQADGWRGFVNVELTTEQKLEAKKLLNDAPRVWDNIFSLISEGYKMTLSYDDARSAYNLSMTCRAERDPNKGLTLSGRGGTEHSAAASFWYKHRVIFLGKWGEGSPGKTQQFEPDELD